MTTVVAGVLERDGRILICQRRADQLHSLKWEFPGGKVEVGESPEAALVRELREELGVETTSVAELMRYEFTYPRKEPILLIFLRAVASPGAIENRIFAAIAWARPDALQSFEFLEGDAPFLTALNGLQWRTERRATDLATS
jgi:8-oxo-dGTP diphosphatase